ncbi:MAG: tRNA pseudouridine(38-40) synthase TruA [Sarcina sp.]
MRNIKLKLEYDGTNFCGWQRQKKGRTVEQTLNEAIEKLTGEKNIELFGSSRTDSGVHAKGYISNFYTNSNIPGERFKDALNTKLPEDLVALESEEVEENFHARYMSTGKTYCYTILNRREPSALHRNSVYHYPGKIDVEKMKIACEYFIGKHDFEAFKSLGSSVKTSVRTITDLHIEQEGDFIKMYVSADGFLYNMVRIIAGTLLKVGSGKIKADKIGEIILSKDRKKAGECAPAKGLCLEKVFYEK